MGLFNHHAGNVRPNQTPGFDVLEPRLLMSGTPFDLQTGHYIDLSTGTATEDHPAQVAMADLNNDGYDDLVVALAA